MMFFQQARDLLGAEHFVQRVVQRPQIGVHLLLHRPGQESETLTGLDHRAHEQDTAHPARLQCLDRCRHRQVGLAGAGRADAEVDVVGQNVAHVLALARAARLHHALGRTQCRLTVGRVFVRRAQRELL